MDRRREKLLPKPQRVSPFIESDADQEHEGTNDSQGQRQGNALGVERQPGPGVDPGGTASFSYDREVQPRPKLEDWSADLDRFLTRNADRAARERLTLVRPRRQRYLAATSEPLGSICSSKLKTRLDAQNASGTCSG